MTPEHRTSTTLENIAQEIVCDRSVSSNVLLPFISEIDCDDIIDEKNNTLLLLALQHSNWDAALILLTHRKNIPLSNHVNKKACELVDQKIEILTSSSDDDDFELIYDSEIGNDDDQYYRKHHTTKEKLILIQQALTTTDSIDFQYVDRTTEMMAKVVNWYEECYENLAETADDEYEEHENYLQETYEAIEDAQDEYEEDIHERNVKITKLKRKNKCLQQSNKVREGDFKITIVNLNGECDRLHKLLWDSNYDLLERDTTITALNNEREQLIAIIQKCEDDIEDKNDTISILNNECDRLQLLVQERDDACCELSIENEALHVKTSDISTSLKFATGQLTKARCELLLLQEMYKFENEGLRQENTLLKESVDKSKDQLLELGDLKDELVTAECRINELQCLLASRHDDVELLGTAYNNSKDTIYELNNEIESLNCDIKQYKQIKIELDNEIESLTSDYLNNIQDIAKLGADLADSDECINELETELVYSKKQVIDQKQQISNLIIDNEIVHQGLTTISDNVNDLERSLETREEEINNLQIQLFSSGDMIRLLKNCNESKRDKIDELTQKNEEHNLEITNLLEQLEECRDKLEECKDNSGYESYKHAALRAEHETLLLEHEQLQLRYADVSRGLCDSVSKEELQEHIQHNGELMKHVQRLEHDQIQLQKKYENQAEHIREFEDTYQQMLQQYHDMMNDIKDAQNIHNHMRIQLINIIDSDDYELSDNDLIQEMLNLANQKCQSRLVNEIGVLKRKVSKQQQEMSNMTQHINNLNDRISGRDQDLAHISQILYNETGVVFNV